MEESSAFKNFINKDVVKTIGEEIHKNYSKFPLKEFLKVASELAPLELKARVLLITAKLKDTLPDSYSESHKILIKAMNGDKLSGFSLWPFSEYICQFGLDHFEESMNAMMVLTQKFTSEFAVRAFFLQDHGKVLKYFSKIVGDKNVHIRRWVSEGSRPILPWGGKIPAIIQDPALTLPLLEKLKYDEELYVRKSVSNHLNDVTKTHPKFVIQVLKKWESEAPKNHQDKIQWIKKQALRTLIKKGDKDALALMGVSGAAKIKLGEIKLNQKKYKLGDKLEFEFEIQSAAKSKQKLVIDYGIDFVKSGGKKSLKIFKLKTLDLSSKETVVVKKSHSLKKITTMTFYKGVHHLVIQINGKKVGEKSFIFDV